MPGPELLKRERVASARRAILERRQAAGSGDVTQADVDLASQVLLEERIRPHPRILLPITGGSLSTVTPLLEDWFARFALRGVDPNAPDLDLPTRVALNVQLLVAQLVAAVREQIRGSPDPTQALIAAAQLGQHLALRAQIKALETQRDQLTESLSAMTHRVARIEAEQRANAETSVSLEATVRQLRASCQVTPRPPNADPTLKRVLAEVNALRKELKPSRRVTAKSASSRSQQARPKPRSAGRLKRLPKRRGRAARRAR